MKKQEFRSSDLRLCSLSETWAHIVELMRLANEGVAGARELVDPVIDRYFERVDAEAERNTR